MPGVQGPIAGVAQQPQPQPQPQHNLIVEYVVRPIFQVIAWMYEQIISLAQWIGIIQPAPVARPLAPAPIDEEPDAYHELTSMLSGVCLGDRIEDLVIYPKSANPLWMYATALFNHSLPNKDSDYYDTRHFFGKRTINIFHFAYENLKDRFIAQGLSDQSGEKLLGNHNTERFLKLILLAWCPEFFERLNRIVESLRSSGSFFSSQQVSFGIDRSKNIFLIYKSPAVGTSDDRTLVAAVKGNGTFASDEELEEIKIELSQSDNKEDAEVGLPLDLSTAVRVADSGLSSVSPPAAAALMPADSASTGVAGHVAEADLGLFSDDDDTDDEGEDIAGQRVDLSAATAHGASSAARPVIPPADAEQGDTIALSATARSLPPVPPSAATTPPLVRSSGEGPAPAEDEEDFFDSPAPAGVNTASMPTVLSDPAAVASKPSETALIRTRRELETVGRQLSEVQERIEAFEQPVDLVTVARYQLWFQRARTAQAGPTQGKKQAQRAAWIDHALGIIANFGELPEASSLTDRVTHNNVKVLHSHVATWEVEAVRVAEMDQEVMELEERKATLEAEIQRLSSASV